MTIKRPSPYVPIFGTGLIIYGISIFLSGELLVFGKAKAFSLVGMDAYSMATFFMFLGLFFLSDYLANKFVKYGIKANWILIVSFIGGGVSFLFWWI